MRVRAWPNGSGSGWWRMLHPLHRVSTRGHYCEVTDEAIDPNKLHDFDILIPQAIVDIKGLLTLRELQVTEGKRISTDFDDFIKVTKDNPHYQEHQVTDALRMLRSFCKFVDQITTTNDYLAERLRKYNPNVKVIPNYMEMDVWKLPIKRHDNGRVRICWVGSITHILDIAMLVNPLKRIMDDFKDQVEVVFMGDPRARELFEGYPIEIVLGVPFETYPTKLNGLGMDIGLCPLRDTRFNRCKSHIKWFENTIAGGATVASPVVYGDVIKEGIDGYIARNDDEWYEKIADLIRNPDKRLKMWQTAYDRVTTKYALENHVDEWENAYRSLV